MKESLILNHKHQMPHEATLEKVPYPNLYHITWPIGIPTTMLKW